MHFVSYSRFFERTHYCLSKKSSSILYSKILYKMGKDFLDIQDFGLFRISAIIKRIPLFHIALVIKNM